MADPLSIGLGVASLGLGAASLTIQIFEGVKKGYEYFELAADMPDDCASFKLRLRIEYTRFIAWASMAGLTDKNDHEKYDQRFKGNRAIVLAVLSEMNALFEFLQKDYEQLQWDKTDEFRALEDKTNQQADASHAYGTAIQFDITSHGERLSEGMKLPTPPKQSLDKVDLSNYSMFQYAKGKKKQQQHTGFNHILTVAKKMKTVSTEQPRKRWKWAALDRKKYHDKLERLAQLTDYLHEIMGDYQLDLLTQSTRETYLAMLQLTVSVQEIKDLLGAAKIAPIADGELSDSASIFSQAPTLVDRSVGNLSPRTAQTFFERLTEFKIVYTEIHSSGSNPGTRLDAVSRVELMNRLDQDVDSRTDRKSVV